MTNDNDKTPLEFADLKTMTEQEINENWEEVAQVMTDHGKPKKDDDDA